VTVHWHENKTDQTAQIIKQRDQITRESVFSYPRMTLTLIHDLHT